MTFQDELTVRVARILIASTAVGAGTGVVSVACLAITLRSVSYLPVWAVVLALLGATAGLAAGAIAAVTRKLLLHSRRSTRVAILPIIFGAAAFAAGWGAFVSTYDPDAILTMIVVAVIGAGSLAFSLWLAIER